VLNCATVSGAITSKTLLSLKNKSQLMLGRKILITPRQSAELIRKCENLGFEVMIETELPLYLQPDRVKSQLHPKLKRRSHWYIQQIYKLYAADILTQSSSSPVVISCDDVFFHPDYKFTDKNSEPILRVIKHEPRAWSLTVQRLLNHRNISSWSFTSEHITVNKKIMNSLFSLIGVRTFQELVLRILDEVNATTQLLQSQESGKMNVLASKYGFYSDCLSEYDLLGNVALLTDQEIKIYPAKHARFSRRSGWLQISSNPYTYPESIAMESQ
jgi:hypothetical protein